MSWGFLGSIWPIRPKLAFCTSSDPSKLLSKYFEFVLFSRAQRLKCANADWPDRYGHYREAKFTQTKHHWWWKANRIFDQLRVTRNHNGKYYIMCTGLEEVLFRSYLLPWGKIIFWRILITLGALVLLKEMWKLVMGSSSKSRVRVIKVGFFRFWKKMEIWTPSFIFIAFLCTNVFQNSIRWECFLKKKFWNEKYYFSV